MSAIAALCAVTACLFAGDSLAVGMSRAANQRSVAISGISTGHQSILLAVRRAAPGTIVFVSTGTNDTVSATSAAARVSSEARVRGVRLVWLLPPCYKSASLDARSRKRAAEIAAAAASAGVETVALRELNAGACDAPRSSDGIHFTARGYRELVEQVAEALSARR